MTSLELLLTALIAVATVEVILLVWVVIRGRNYYDE